MIFSNLHRRHCHNLRYMIIQFINFMITVGLFIGSDGICFIVAVVAAVLLVIFVGTGVAVHICLIKRGICRLNDILVLY